MSYWHVNPELDERESVRDALDTLRNAVEKGGVRTRVGRVWAFEEAKGAFRQGQEEGGVAVVRVKEV